MNKIELSPKDLMYVKKILSDYPQTVVFGSRAKGTSRTFSDLDVCLKDSIASYDYELLKEKFEESNLPFKVDLILYSRCDDTFKKIIDSQGIPLFLQKK